MRNIKEVINENNEKITIEILIGFKIEELNKEYIAYTINDNNIDEEIDVCISEIIYIDDKPYINSIEENEAEKVLLFYETLKQTI